MSQHTLTIYPTFEIEDPVELSDINIDSIKNVNCSNFWNSRIKSLSQSIGLQRPKSTYASSLPVIALPPMSPIPFFDHWLDHWTGSTHKFKQRPKNKIEFKNIDILNESIFNDIIFGHDFITLNADMEDQFKDLLDNLQVNNDLIVEIELLKSKKKLYIRQKKFMKKLNGRSVHYFDELTPSHIKYNSSINLNETSIFDYDKKVSYLELHCYNELSLLVKIINNPPENKIVPAVVVTDLMGNPLEVHCYYKKKCISPEIMKELKPNLLTENFFVDGYFDKRDIEFLDMTII